MANSYFFQIHFALWVVHGRLLLLLPDEPECAGVVRRRRALVHTGLVPLVGDAGVGVKTLLLSPQSLLLLLLLLSAETTADLLSPALPLSLAKFLRLFCPGLRKFKSSARAGLVGIWNTWLRKKKFNIACMIFGKTWCLYLLHKELLLEGRLSSDRKRRLSTRWASDLHVNRETMVKTTKARRMQSATALRGMSNAKGVGGEDWRDGHSLADVDAQMEQTDFYDVGLSLSLSHSLSLSLSVCLCLCLSVVHAPKDQKKPITRLFAFG